MKYKMEQIRKKLNGMNINKDKCGGALGVMVIVVGNGHDDTSSNPWRDWLHFTKQ